MGKRYRGVDDPKVVTGQPLFGIDVQLPDMVYANFTKCPAVGGKVKSFNVDEIKALPGVLDAFVVEGTGMPIEVMPGVAIIGKDTWSGVPGQGQAEGGLGRKRGVEGFHVAILSPRRKNWRPTSRKSPTTMSAMWTRPSPTPQRRWKPITSTPSPRMRRWSR